LDLPAQWYARAVLVNTNYMYARFETDSDEYEKFFADMAKAIQKAKIEKKPN
jgi:hypothetical protein